MGTTTKVVAGTALSAASVASLVGFINGTVPDVNSIEQLDGTIRDSLKGHEKQLAAFNNDPAAGRAHYINSLVQQEYQGQLAADHAAVAATKGDAHTKAVDKLAADTAKYRGEYLHHHPGLQKAVDANGWKIFDDGIKNVLTDIGHAGEAVGREAKTIGEYLSHHSLNEMWDNAGHSINHQYDRFKHDIGHASAAQIYDELKDATKDVVHGTEHAWDHGVHAASHSPEAAAAMVGGVAVASVGAAVAGSGLKQKVFAAFSALAEKMHMSGKGASR